MKKGERVLVRLPQFGLWNEVILELSVKLLLNLFQVSRFERTSIHIGGEGD